MKQPDLTIDEVLALIEYHDKMSANIPKNWYSKINATGKKMGAVAEKHDNRARNWKSFLDNTWPK
jgi:hypothetical protein